MDSIATKHGDKGKTSLLYGGRVSKSDIIVEVVGTGDEAIAALGLAYATSSDEFVRRLLRDLQERLFALNARLATSSSQIDKLEMNFALDEALDINRLEQILQDLEQKVQLPPNFIIPGASIPSASIDLARTIVRRMERLIVKMCESELLADFKMVAYVNRMSDVLFLLARYQDNQLDQPKLTGLRRTENI